MLIEANVIVSISFDAENCYKYNTYYVDNIHTNKLCSSTKFQKTNEPKTWLGQIAYDLKANCQRFRFAPLIRTAVKFQGMQPWGFCIESLAEALSILDNFLEWPLEKYNEDEDEDEDEGLEFRGDNELKSPSEL
jgi:hypothetical protein